MEDKEKELKQDRSKKIVKWIYAILIIILIIVALLASNGLLEPIDYRDWTF